jgi:hypothetical protein
MEAPMPSATVTSNEGKVSTPEVPGRVEKYYFDENLFPNERQMSERTEFWEKQFPGQGRRLAAKELAKTDIPLTPQQQAKETFDLHKAIVDMYMPNATQSEKDEMAQYLGGLLGKELPAVQRANNEAIKTFIKLRANNPKMKFAELLEKMPEDMKATSYALVEKLETIFGKEGQQAETAEERKERFEEEKRHHRALENTATEHIKLIKDKSKKDTAIKDMTKKVNNFFDRFDKEYEKVVAMYTRPAKDHPAPKGNIPTRDEFWSGMTESKAVNGIGASYRREWYDIMGAPMKDEGTYVEGGKKQWHEMPSRQLTIDELESLHESGEKKSSVETHTPPKVPAKMTPQTKTSSKLTPPPMIAKSGDPLREKAIKELNDEGYPTTEANIKEAMRQLKEQ